MRLFHVTNKKQMRLVYSIVFFFFCDVIRSPRSLARQQELHLYDDVRII